MLEISGTKVFGLDIRRPESIVFLLLLAVLLSVAITTGTWDLGNSRIVMYHEIFFSFCCVCLLRGGGLVGLVSENRVIAGVLVLWFLSISYSLLSSPYNLAYLSVGRARYFETVSHVVFFALSLSLLRLYSLPLRLFFVVLLLSNAFVVVQAILVWNYSPEPDIRTSSAWFSRFPFVGHARHVGYNMIVAMIAGIFLLLESTSRRNSALLACGLLLVSACLFWLGGRGAMLSTLLAFLLLMFSSIQLKDIGLPRVTLVCIVVLGAALAAHYSAQFSWNGVVNSVERSAAASDVNRLSSGRLAIWVYSIKALGEDYLFGLGSQGYLFIPGKLRSTAMPHNVFVQFLVEWGVIGTLLFSAAFLYALRQGFIRLRYFDVTRLPELSAVLVVAALSLHGLTDGTFYHGKASFYLALCLAVCLAKPVAGVDGVAKSVS